MLNFLKGFYTATNPGEIDISGPTSWLYYLFGAVFLLLTIVCVFFMFKYRNSKKEFEPIAQTFSTIKRFWLLNRFLFFVLLSIILGICAIIFFSMNSMILGEG